MAHCIISLNPSCILLSMPSFTQTSLYSLNSSGCGYMTGVSQQDASRCVTNRWLTMSTGKAYLKQSPGPRQCVCYAANGYNVQTVQQDRHTSSKSKFHVFLLQIVLKASHAEFDGNDDHSSIFQTSGSMSEFQDTHQHFYVMLGIKHKTGNIIFSMLFFPSTIFILKLRKPGGKWGLGFKSWLISHLVFMIFQILCPIF